MTGLDIEKDKIIEMACIITDSELNVLAEVMLKQTHAYIYIYYFFNLKEIVSMDDQIKFYNFPPIAGTKSDYKSTNWAPGRNVWLVQRASWQGVLAVLDVSGRYVSRVTLSLEEPPITHIAKQPFYWPPLQYFLSIDFQLAKLCSIGCPGLLINGTIQKKHCDDLKQSSGFVWW